jgi:integrase/recombinase XerD
MDTIESTTLVVIDTPSLPVPVYATPVQAESDDHLIELWLHGRSAGTQRAYAADIASFRAYVRQPLRDLTLGMLQGYQDSLASLASASQARKMSAVKSLLSQGHKLGYLPINLGAAITLPKGKNVLAERILDRESVHDMLALERNPRNKVLLRLLYLAGLRISEACNLRVRDLQPNGATGQITVYGKGGKTRVVLLKASLWKDLASLRGADLNAPVFLSRESRDGAEGALDPSQVHRIVKAAALRAGLSPDVSAHWLRHAHVSHALDAGAPIHLVQSTVGHASLATTSKYAHARPTESSSTYLQG